MCRLQAGRWLTGVPGVESPGVVTAMDFLRWANTGDVRAQRAADVDVVVVGGGSVRLPPAMSVLGCLTTLWVIAQVAMDAATTAKALGADNVYAVSLEDLKVGPAAQAPAFVRLRGVLGRYPRQDLPADEDEVENARKMGVIFRPNTRLVEVNLPGTSTKDNKN